MGSTRYRRGSKYAADMAEYARLMSEDNHVEISRLKRNLACALREEVTEVERTAMELYYGQRLTMTEIARRLGVVPSTVSRNLKRGEAKLRRCLRYGAARLLEEASPEHLHVAPAQKL